MGHCSACLTRCGPRKWASDDSVCERAVHRVGHGFQVDNVNAESVNATFELEGHAAGVDGPAALLVLPFRSGYDGVKRCRRSHLSLHRNPPQVSCVAMLVMERHTISVSVIVGPAPDGPLALGIDD